MKIFVMLLFLVSINTYGYVERFDEIKSRSFSNWFLSFDGLKDENGVLVFDRIIKNKKQSYKVADVSFISIKNDEELNIRTLKSTLESAHNFRGFDYTKSNNSYRFEGYDIELNRQIVYIFSKDRGNLLITRASYRDSYGTRVGIEVELLSRELHAIKSKFYPIKLTSFMDWFIGKAYAQIPCSSCAGNPICLMACSGRGTGGIGSSGTSGSSGGTGGLGGLGGLGGMGGATGFDLTDLYTRLDNMNGQIDVLNSNIEIANTNWGDTNVQLGDANVNWADTNTQLGNANQNWADTNVQLGNANQNWEETNQQLESLNNTIDQRSADFLKESDEWQELTRQESQAWREMADRNADRALSLGEKLSDPKHIFKMAASAAAGAALGAAAVGLAVNGAKAVVSFLAKWISGDLKKAKEEEVLRMFNQAKKSWLDNSKLVRELEKGIDQTLRSIELRQKFEMSNTDLMSNIDLRLLDYQDRLASKREEASELPLNSCARQQAYAEVLGLKNEVVELESLATILNQGDPLLKTCRDLREAFRQLAEAEGLLQRIRPNILTAERLVNERVMESQKNASEQYEDLRKNRDARRVRRAQNNHLDFLEEQNKLDTQHLQGNVQRDCRRSFRRAGLRSMTRFKDRRRFCNSLIGVQGGDSESIEASIREYFGDSLIDNEVESLMHQFEISFIPEAIQKVRTYERGREQVIADQSNNTEKHEDYTKNMNDLLSLDPEIAAGEIRAMNDFFEKVLSEQSMLFSKDLSGKRLEIEEKCAGVDPLVNEDPFYEKYHEELAKAQDTIEELDGTNINGTHLYCSNELATIECANALKRQSEYLSENPSKVQRVVLVPRSKMLAKSQLFKPKANSDYNFAQVSIGVNSEQLPKVMGRLDKKLTPQVTAPE